MSDSGSSGSGVEDPTPQMNGDDPQQQPNSNGDSNSEEIAYADSEESIVVDPGFKLEDCRSKFGANTPEGRGPGTASGRGYNTERLVNAVFGNDMISATWSADSHYDTFVADEPHNHRVEAKCCVDQYPSGGSGRFRIWGDNHTAFLSASRDWERKTVSYLYFFAVYTIDSGREKELGKLIATVAQVDEVLDHESWCEQDHETMGTQPVKDLSWTSLLTRLNVSEDRFRNADIVDLTTRESD